MSDRPIHTEYESMMEQAFRDANIIAYTDMVYCFICGQTFYWYERQNPSHCRCITCCFRYEDYAQMARPDFVIFRNITYPDQGIGIVRIDGAIHQSNRKKMLRDYHQVQQFLDRGVKVFIIQNEEIKNQTPLALQEKACFIWSMIKDDKLYEMYKDSLDFKERTKRIS